MNCEVADTCLRCVHMCTYIFIHSLVQLNLVISIFSVFIDKTAHKQVKYMYYAVNEICIFKTSTKAELTVPKNAFAEC